MNVFHNAARSSIGRHAMVGLGLLAVYTLLPLFGVIGGFQVGAPGLELIPQLQGLLVPVLIGTAYSAYKGNSRLVRAIGVTPACSAVLIFGIVYPAGNPSLLGLDFLIVTVAVGVLFLAVSGVWTILGYAIGTALRWRQHDSVSKHQRTAAKRWIVITTAGIIPAYIVSVWLWGLHWEETTEGVIVLLSVVPLV